MPTYASACGIIRVCVRMFSRDPALAQRRMRHCNPTGLDGCNPNSLTG